MFKEHHSVQNLVIDGDFLPNVDSIMEVFLAIVTQIS